MKKINKIEEVKNKDVRLEDVGINRTFYWTYIRTQETTNENLDFEDVILSDRNASSDYAAFYDAFTGLDNIDFNSVYAKYWTDDNYYEQCKKKSIKCAEVLVPHYIPFDYVMCAAVVNENAKINLKSTGFNKKIFIEPSVFFRS